MYNVVPEKCYPNTITTLFLDIGDVLLSNGWGHESRKLAAQKFNLDLAEMEARHKLVFATSEEGKANLFEYLEWVIFYEHRDFSIKQFRDFMFAQTVPYLGMIDFFKKLKEKYNLKIVVVSNEAKELNAFRIATFKLNEWVDCFVSSCFVHLRKPDADIFRLALNLSQVNPKQVVYIDDTQLFIDVAAGLGIKGIRHLDLASTIQALAGLGLGLTVDIKINNNHQDNQLNHHLANII